MSVAEAEADGCLLDRGKKQPARADQGGEKKDGRSEEGKKRP